MKKLRRALRGYRPTAVQHILLDMQENHRVRMDEVKKQIDLLSEEHKLMTMELNRSIEPVRNHSSGNIEQTMAKRLFDAHLKQTDAVRQQLQQLKAEEDERLAETEAKQLERDQIIEHVDHKLKETLSIMSEGRGTT